MNDFNDFVRGMSLAVSEEKKRRFYGSAVPEWLEGFERLFNAAQDYVPGSEHAKPPEFYKQPVIPPQWPKLLVNYEGGGPAKAFVIVNSDTEWNSYRGWFVRPLTELESIKADGAKETTPGLEDWEQRQQNASEGKPYWEVNS